MTIGFVRFGPGAIRGPDLVRSAITAAAAARETQRVWSMYNSDSDKIIRRSFTLLTDLREALAQPGQLSLVYQPKLDMHSGRCRSAEALLRWTHPVLGNISPAEFIPLAEQTAMARPVTEWVVREAVRQAAEWHRAKRGICVSINISARNLEERDFADRLRQTMQANDLPPEAIELEFTESALMSNAAGILDQLYKIKAMGVEIAIDDFGTGYSNHSYLQKIPAKTVKIDQSLIRDLATSKRDQTIVQSTIEMMHKLDYQVVAEGIESAAIYDQLAAWNCDEAQGYFIARPLAAGALTDWLTSRG